ncbi:hypothetical protein [Terrabacter sp. 2YAF2]|uniref:hypothetical protein n=1 Tax=Terrabacter sp. 2YAF2 TaxID=3233026 RepID=UPI003F9735AE
MSAEGTNGARAARKAWRSLPRRTRRELVLAAVKGQRPRTDPATWRTALDWAQLYPAQALPQVLMAACFLYLAIRGIYDQFSWLVVGFACLLVVDAAWTAIAASRIRRSPGPVDPGQPSARTVGHGTP